MTEHKFEAPLTEEFVTAICNENKRLNDEIERLREENKRLREAADDLANYVSRCDWYHYVKDETRAALEEKE